MVTFVNGKPGDGKSLYAVMLLLAVLVQGDAYVVTNIPLVAAAVAAFVNAERKKRKDDRVFSFDDEVRVLKDEETYEFYRRRGGDLVLSPSPDFECDVKDRLGRPEFIAKMKSEFLRIKETGGDALRPVYYFIDEAHNFFSAREWTTAGRGLLYYVSQHRHLHDQIYVITQVTENVEKQLRGLASELHRVRNQLRRSIGPFKMRPCFKIHKFYGVPNEGTQVTPFDIQTMFLDPAGVAGCYHTVGALGVQTKPEKITNSGKFPWWSLPLVAAAGIALVALTFVALPWLAGKGSTKLLMSVANVPVVQAATGPHQDKSSNDSSQVPRGETRAISENSESRSPGPIGTPDLWVSSIAWGRNQVNVSLTDGRVLSEGDGILARVERNYVVLVDGRKIYKKPGAGAKGAPVRQDTEVPVAVIPATTERKPLEAKKSTGLPGETKTESPPPQQQGSWVVGSDGVSRLRVPETLTTAAGR